MEAQREKQGYKVQEVYLVPLAMLERGVLEVSEDKLDLQVLLASLEPRVVEECLDLTDHRVSKVKLETEE